MIDFIKVAHPIISENAQVFQLIQENGLHGVIICKINKHDEYWYNPKLVHSLGYNTERELSLQKIISPEGNGEIKRILKTPDDFGEILTGEINFLHSKGFLIPMTYKSLQVGEHVVIAFKKISDFSHIENNAELNFQREQLLGTVLDTINIGVIACDSKGKLLLFNKAAKKWHGLPPQNIPQTEYAKYYNLYEADGKTLFKTEEIPLLNMLQEGIIRKKKMIIHSVKGKKRAVVVNGARLFDKNENISGAVIAMYDVSELEQIENQLAISETMFRGTFENAVDGMAISDVNGNFTAINESLCQMVGYSAGELKKMNFLEITHPEDIEDDLKVMKELLNSERENVHKEKRFINKNGSTVHVLLSVSIVKDHKLNPLYMIAQMSDLTELKSAQEENVRMLGITKEQNERLKNFANIVAHNLRSNSGNIEMLLDIYTEEHPETKEDEVIKMALTASNKLKETIVDLNEVAFINMSVSEKLIPINLKKSVTNTLESLNALTKKANLRVFNLIPAHLEVLSLPAYLESIILNFATNAIKYRSLERDPILRFEAQKREENIELSIEDNGIGIDLKKFEKNLFGMYKTFHHNEDAKGIGLFITKNQIEAMGGKIEVKSEVNKGTTFTIFFKYDKQ
ncbi:MAG: PAS domain S-box protein [Gillisia sp.]